MKKQCRTFHCQSTYMTYSHMLSMLTMFECCFRIYKVPVLLAVSTVGPGLVPGPIRGPKLNGTGTGNNHRDQKWPGPRLVPVPVPKRYLAVRLCPHPNIWKCSTVTVSDEGWYLLIDWSFVRSLLDHLWIFSPLDNILVRTCVIEWYKIWKYIFNITLDLFILLENKRAIGHLFLASAEGCSLLGPFSLNDYKFILMRRNT